jgi:hypothetical protein
VLRIAFHVDGGNAATVFFARNWGVLIALVGALLVYAAYAPTSRVPILIAAVVEKLVLVACIFFGPLKRTPIMTAIALGDGLFAVTYLLYLGGV